MTEHEPKDGEIRYREEYIYYEDRGDIDGMRFGFLLVIVAVIAIAILF